MQISYIMRHVCIYKQSREKIGKKTCFPVVHFTFQQLRHSISDFSYCFCKKLITCVLTLLKHNFQNTATQPMLVIFTQNDISQAGCQYDTIHLSTKFHLLGSVDVQISSSKRKLKTIFTKLFFLKKPHTFPKSYHYTSCQDHQVSDVGHVLSLLCYYFWFQQINKTGNARNIILRRIRVTTVVLGKQ